MAQHPRGSEGPPTWPCFGSKPVQRRFQCFNRRGVRCYLWQSQRP
jgi:hypothetical protein